MSQGVKTHIKTLRLNSRLQHRIQNNLYLKFQRKISILPIERDSSTDLGSRLRRTETVQLSQFKLRIL